MEKPYRFTSPESGREYSSEHPIHRVARANTLFVEKLKGLDDMNSYSQIPTLLLKAESNKVSVLEKMMKENGKQLNDLVHLRSRHPAERDDAERAIEQFIYSVNERDSRAIVKRICQLI